MKILRYSDESGFSLEHRLIFLETERPANDMTAETADKAVAGKEQAAAADPRQQREALQLALEKECRVLDTALLNMFRQNYRTGGSETAKASFEVLGPELLKRLGESVDFIMAFNADTDKMMVPYDYAEYVAEGPVGNICTHEVTHAMTDQEGTRKGLLADPKYAGPDYPTIMDYARQRSQGKEFDGIRELIGIRIFTDKVMQRMRQFPEVIEKGRKSVIGVNERLRALKGELAKGEEFGQVPLDSVQQQWLEKAFIERQGVWARFQQADTAVVQVIRERLAPAAEEFINAFQQRPPDVTAADFTRSNYLQSKRETLEKCMQEMASTFGQYQSVTTEVVDLYESHMKEMQQILDQNRALWKTQMQAKIAAETDPQQKTGLIETYEIVLKLEEVDKISAALATTMERMGDVFGGTATLVEETANTLTLENSIESSREIVENPDEVLARMIDSMYSVYLGGYDQNNFPLTETDLEFLETIRFEGKPLFAKGISKYRLALQMVADGMPPAEVTKQLRTATAYEYKGKRYEWLHGNFDLKGDLPEVNSIEEFIKN